MINLDLSKIAAAITEKNKEGLRSKKGWAEELNIEIKRVLLKQGILHLINPDKKNLALESAFSALLGGLLAHFTGHLESIATGPLIIILLKALIETFVIVPLMKEKGIGYRPSYISFAEIHLDKIVRLTINILRHDLFFVLEDPKEKTPSLPPNP